MEARRLGLEAVLGKNVVGIEDEEEGTEGIDIVEAIQVRIWLTNHSHHLLFEEAFQVESVEGA